MRRLRGGSASLHASLAEFAWILLFLSLGAAAGLFVREHRIRTERDAAVVARNEALEARAAAEAERDALGVELAEVRLDLDVALARIRILQDKQNAAVACYLLPDAALPAVTGTITLHGVSKFTVARHTGESRYIEKLRYRDVEPVVTATIRQLFAADFAYVARRNCYLRFRVENLTNDYRVYERFADILGDLGIVVINPARPG